MFNNDYILSVTQLNEYVASQLKQDILLGNIGVRGEISGLVKHSSGHMFFSLKDENALVRCTMFRQYADAVRYKLDLKDGMQVLVRGSAMLYVKDGQFRINVRSIEKEGSGVIFEKFNRLKEKLAAEGLFDDAHKKTIPYLPKCVGVVTSPTGAALQDIINITRRRFENMNICVCPVMVQGVTAAQDIARGIRYMDKNKLCDVMIVGRGGGSIEDLWAFNEEVVARAIYESETPIVSAVGHETDFSIADFVADMRAPTPSAAAELCVPLYESLTETVSKYHGIINRSVEGALALQKSRLSSLMSSAVLASPKNVLQNCRVKLGNYSVLMTESVKNKIEIAVQEYAGADARLNALSPLNVLDRGYALIKSGENYITDVSKMNVGDEADIVMRDGTVTVTVKEIKGKNK